MNTGDDNNGDPTASSEGGVSDANGDGDPSAAAMATPDPEKDSEEGRSKKDKREGSFTVHVNVPGDKQPNDVKGSMTGHVWGTVEDYSEDEGITRGNYPRGLRDDSGRVPSRSHTFDGLDQDQTKKMRDAILDKSDGYGPHSHCVHHTLKALDAGGIDHPDFGKGWDATPSEVGAWVDSMNDPM